jgi:hypothetical protein
MFPFTVVLTRAQRQQWCETIRFRDYQARYAKEPGNSPAQSAQTADDGGQPLAVGRDAAVSGGDVEGAKPTLKEKPSTISNTTSESELIDAENCMLRPTSTGCRSYRGSR